MLGDWNALGNSCWRLGFFHTISFSFFLVFLPLPFFFPFFPFFPLFFSSSSLTPVLSCLLPVYCASQMGRLSGTPTDFLLSQPALPKVMSYRTMATAGLCTIATIDTWTPLILALTGSGDMELHQKNIESASFNCFWPSSPSELLGWVGVSVTAGVAEEILFRGFLPHYLLTYCNVSSVALAHAISAVLFGAGHLYARTSSDAGILSNWKGALGSMIIGGMFSLVALQTNSIRIPIVCHALIDVGVGAFAYTVRQQRKTIKKVD